MYNSLLKDYFKYSALANLEPLFAPLANTPHTARKPRITHKRIIRISSPADDCSVSRLGIPMKPDDLRPEYGRRSMAYLLEREEAPNPQGQ